MNDERNDDRTREIIERLEREFGQRHDESADEPVETFARREPETSRDNMDPRKENAVPIGGAPQMQRVRLSLPLSKPRVVYALLAINVLMYGLTLALSYLSRNAVDPRFGDAFTMVLYELGAKYGPAIDAGQYWRFITPIFLHGGLIHLAFNSYALYALGPETERVYGSTRFLAIYMLAGFAGSIASYVHSPGLSIGASGAIFGLIGALAAFFYSARGLLGAEASRRQITQLISLAAINIVIGLSVQAVDNAAHLGGLCAGAIAGFVLAPRYRIDERLYPPVVVRGGNAAVNWLLAALLLLVLVAWAFVSVGRYS